MGKNTNKSVSGKYTQNLLYNAKKPGRDALKIASKRAIQKATETIGVITGMIIADKITFTTSQSVLGTALNISAYPKISEILKEIYILPEKRQQTNISVY